VQRFYDPLEGEILFNGVDVRAVNVSSLREHIGERPRERQRERQRERGGEIAQ